MNCSCLFSQCGNTAINGFLLVGVSANQTTLSLYCKTICSLRWVEDSLMHMWIMNEVTLHYSSITRELNSVVRDVNLLETSSRLQSPIWRSWSTQSQTIKAVVTPACRYITHIHLSQSRISQTLPTYRHKKQLKQTCIHSDMDAQPAPIVSWSLFHLLHLPAALDYRYCQRVLQGAELTRFKQNKAVAEPRYVRNIRSNFFHSAK